MGEERTGREIEFASDGEEARGYLALPASGRGPGVIVIQEWWGLVPHIRDVCDRLAREGFVALAPDLYRGESTTDPDEAGRLMMELEIERAGRDLATRNRRIGAVADFYGIHPNVTLDLAGLEAAVLGIFAERDAYATPDAVRKLESELSIQLFTRVHRRLVPTQAAERPASGGVFLT